MKKILMNNQEIIENQINIGDVDGNEGPGITTYVYSFGIDSEEVNDFIQSIEGANNEINVVYFSSEGGAVTACEMFVDYVRDCGRYFEFRVNGSIMSCGLEAMEKVSRFDNVDVMILETSFGMAHLPDISVSLRNSRNTKGFENFIKKLVDKMSEKAIAYHTEFLFDPHMTADDRDEYIKGSDVWIDYETLNSYFESLQKGKKEAREKRMIEMEDAIKNSTEVK